MVQNIQISGGDEITEKSETVVRLLEFGGGERRPPQRKTSSKVPRMYTVEIYCSSWYIGWTVLFKPTKLKQSESLAQ